MKKIVNILVITILFLFVHINANAQGKWLDIYKGGIRVMSIDASKLDSIVFREDDGWIEMDPEPQQRTAMSFCPNLKRQTRSTSTADVKIEEFAVSCKKEDGTYLFTNYLCKRFPDSIGNTVTNRNGWDYVFGDQVTQYWESDAVNYTFQAIAFKEGHHADVSFEDGVASIVVNSDNIDAVFATGNLKTSNSNSGLVTLDFSPLASKVELSFFEEVPGYDATITHFYNSKGEAVDFPVIIGTFANEGVAKIGWNRSQNNISPTTYVSEISFCNNIWDGKIKDNRWDSSINPCSMYTLPGEGVDAKIQFDLQLTSSIGEVIDLKQLEVALPQAYTKWDSGSQYQYSIKISDPFSAGGIIFYGVSISSLDMGESGMTR